ncbi:MAG: hypothetical protein UW95_C0004G0010 [Parcubacteria group bacterium GW2011_GWC1_45_14]|nr:MAG: hypothetical protein UW95_C0004G0010 [Parcubacteria group bacterium GW2011_GWC1_45_14]
MGILYLQHLLQFLRVLVRTDDSQVQFGIMENIPRDPQNVLGRYLVDFFKYVFQRHYLFFANFLFDEKHRNLVRCLESHHALSLDIILGFLKFFFPHFFRGDFPVLFQDQS